MEESWKPYLNAIIAVHDVTAFGTPSLANSYFCIYLYSYQILIRFLLSDPDDVTVFIIFNGFSIMKTTYDFTYRTIIRHQRSHCKYQILNVQSQSWSLLEFVKITTFELPLTNQTTAKITHTEHTKRFIAAYSARNDKTKLPSSRGHQTDHNSHLLGGRKIGLLRLTYHTHTRIYLEEIGLLFVTSKAPST